MPAARTAFVRVFFDRGQGSRYLGLYTLVEIPDGPMLEIQFGTDNGNLYKPNGNGARWTVFDPQSFPKKTNQRDEDWTDVQDAIAVLNESRANPPVWRMRLEARFAVSSFLRWLALNTIIGNTDTYGGFSPHNYWVYGSPRHRDRLFFIPWDHDLALNASGPGGGFGGGGAGANTGLDLFHDRVNASWPLIRYLMDDPVYRAAYRGYIEELLNTVFEPSAVTARLQAEYARIAPYVVGPEGEQPERSFLQSPEEFTQAVTNLMTYVRTRSAVRAAGVGRRSMTGNICRFLALCAVIAAPAAGQNAQEPKKPQPPPPVFELIPEAYIQLDWRAYPESSVAPGTGRLEFNTFEVRRMRAGATGRWRGARFELTLDPQDVDGTLVKDAYVEVRPGSYEIRFGQFKPPGSRDYGTSARQHDFLERTALGGSLSAQRDLGVSLHGDIGQHVDYDVGVFAGDNNGASSRSGLTGAGRLEWEPRGDLVLAMYGSEGRLRAVESDPENGLEARLSSG